MESCGHLEIDLSELGRVADEARAKWLGRLSDLESDVEKDPEEEL